MSLDTHAKVLAIFTDSLAETIIPREKSEHITQESSTYKSKRNELYFRRITPDITSFTDKYNIKLPLNEVPKIEGLKDKFIFQTMQSQTGFFFLDISKDKRGNIILYTPEPVINYIKQNVPNELLKYMLESMYKTPFILKSLNKTHGKIKEPYRCFGQKPHPHDEIMLPVLGSTGSKLARGLICPHCSNKTSFMVTLTGFNPLLVPIQFTLETGLTFIIRVETAKWASEYRVSKDNNNKMSGKIVLWASFAQNEIHRLTGEFVLQRLIAPSLPVLDDTRLYLNDTHLDLKQKLIEILPNITNGETTLTLGGKIVALVEKHYEQSFNLENW